MTEGAEIWQLLVAAAVGFVVGSINPATLFARARGINLHDVGSGNPGATNTARVLGTRTGVIVGLLDILKGLLPAVAFTVWWGGGAGEVAGLAAVLGHIFSPFLHGRGGKGVATTLGAVLGAQPLWAVPMLAGFGLTYAVTRTMGLAAVGGAVVLIGIGVWWADSVDEQAFAIILGTVVIIRHQRNIRAAIAGVSHMGREG